MVKGLHLHPAGWKPKRGIPDLYIPSYHDAYRRLLARGGLEVCFLGVCPWNASDYSQTAFPKRTEQPMVA